VKRVLVLGAGLVSRPLVRELAERGDIAVTVADREASRAREVLSGAPGSAVSLDVADGTAVAAFVRECDLVVSLLPFTLHVAVARAAIAGRRPMITTSYVSPEMRALDAEAAAAGVLVLNEIGLDPGLDHMSAMRVIDRVRRDGGRLTSFRSCCGGIPAPDADTNPWRYKFSWSPRGVLLAGRGGARWLDDGRIVEVDAAHLFAQVAPYEAPGLAPLEVYPNRDSLAYVPTYGIEGVQTMFRGTLRWPGWAATLEALFRLGLLEDAPRTWRSGTTHAEFAEAFAAPGSGPLRSRLAARAGVAADSEVMERLVWAGLLSDRPLERTEASPLDVLEAMLAPRMAYAPGDRDLVVLRHEFGFIDREGRPRREESTLVAFGEAGGDSAMARTVSLPAAVAARLILDGRIGLTGVRIPVDPAIYEPVLAALEPLGIRFE
jgi:saccharopine dehydrogenase-like NADP-dependent oxidoreductase